MRPIEEIRSFFEQDRFAMNQGICIDQVEEGSAVCSVLLQESHHNAGGVAQGGLLFTLADFTFAVAANSGESRAVTLNSSIHFLRPATGGRLTASAKRVSQSRSTCVYLVEVAGEDGILLAQATFTGFIKAMGR